MVLSRNVDAETLARPRRGDIGFICSFMLTFGALLYILRSGPEQFRAGWLVATEPESDGHMRGAAVSMTVT